MLPRPPAPRQPSATATSAAEPPVADIGVGIDTSRYGHHGDGRGRTFSVDLESNGYQCFRVAALDLASTFDLEPSPPTPGTEKRNG